MIEIKLANAELVNEAAALCQQVSELGTANAECRQTQAALQKSKTRYRRFFETAQDGILILDADTGQITDVNHAGVFARAIVG